MPLTTKDIATTKPPEYPVIMVADDGCIKLFVNDTDGIVLRRANCDSEGSGSKLHQSIGHLAAGGRCYDRDGKESGGNPVPAGQRTYWRRFEGELTLAND